MEIDLIGEHIVIGRGASCHVTIDDPMLSRRHVRIDLSHADPVVEDLHSRNGTQLNGRPIVGRAALKDGDRIRLGTQELVFLTPSVPKKNFRTTSGLIFCASCAVPYPNASARCPHCGAAPPERGVGPSVREAGASSWTFHLLSQVVERAIGQGRLADGERMMSRGVRELEEQLDEGVEVAPVRVVGIAECAARLGCSLRSERWLEIGARLYGRAGQAPSRDVLALIDELPADPRLADAVSALRHAGPENRRAS